MPACFIRAYQIGSSGGSHCPWMGMNALENLLESLQKGDNEVIVDPEIARRALIPLERMVSFSASNKLRVRGNA